MTSNDQPEGLSAWGSVQIVPTDSEPHALASPAGKPTAGTISRYTWRPPPGAKGEFPPGFCLTFDCHTRTDGMRRFVPTEGIPGFLVRAALAGYTLLNLHTELSPEERFSYHATRLIYQMAKGFSEFLNRTFSRPSELYTTEAGRISGDTEHILPDDLGLDATGRGIRWTPRELIERGRDAAANPGALAPARFITLGLVEAARLNPLDPATLSEAGARAFIRLALFDLGPATGPLDESVIEEVQGRFLVALEAHIAKDTGAFRRWCFNNINNVVHAIAKQKRGSGPIPRAQVRQALLELVFHSLIHVGDGIHRLMAAFACSLPEPLSEVERAHFDSLYQKQRHYGGLPFVLLHDRFDFLRDAILNVWDDPSDIQRVGVVLRVLSYYSTMVSRRREADRRYKARSWHRNDQNRVAQTLPLEPDLDLGADLRPQPFQEVASALRELHQASCPCGTTQHWHANLIGEIGSPRSIVIQDTCGACKHTETRTILRNVFEEVAKRTLLK